MAEKEINNLRELRKRAGLSQKELGKMLGMTGSGISCYENGNVKLNRALVDKLTEILDCSRADLFANTSNSNSYFKLQGNIPLYDQKAKDVTIFSESNILGYLYTPLVNNTKQYFALVIRTNTADNIGLPIGSYAICRKQGIVKDGEIAIVQLNTNNVILARYYKESDELIRLESCSTSNEFETKTYNLLDEPVNIVGKLIGHQVINEEVA